MFSDGFLEPDLQLKKRKNLESIHDTMEYSSKIAPIRNYLAIFYFRFNI